MTGKSRNPAILVLGANSKLGSLMRAVWQTRQPRDWTLRYVSRAGTAGAIRWAPGQDMGPLGRADAVVALWGVVRGPDLGANALLAEAARDVGRATGARVVMHMSSAAVYGRQAGIFREDGPALPASQYGVAKWEMEQRIAEFDHQGLPEHKILRIGNVVGADSLFGSLSSPEPLVLDRFADGGGPIRSYVCAQTLAEVFLAVAENPENTPAIINVAEAGPVAMSEIAVAAGRPVSWRQAPEGALQRAVLATDRLARLMALDPERATAGGIVADWKSWQGAFP